MTLLGTLSNVFATGDRVANALLRAANGGPALQSTMLTIPAGEPVQLADRDGQTQLITYDGIVKNYPTVWAVWSKLVRNLATTDVGVYEEDGDGRLKRVYGTDLEKLLRQPAPGKGLINLLQWLFNPYLVEGNSVLAKYQPAGPGTKPEAIIPLDWRFLNAWALPGGPVELWVSNQLGDQRELWPNEVIHLAWDSPDGSSIGTSPLQALGTAVRLWDSADRYQIASFDNGSRPAGAFVLPPDSQMDEGDRIALREKAEASHKGVDKAFKIAVLSGGLKWEPMSFSAVEADLINTRNSAQADVCIAYDVRRRVIADDGSGSAGDVQEILRDFQRTLIPHVRLAEQALECQLAQTVDEWAGYRIRFDRSELQRGTYREEVETAVHAYTNGLTSEDEARVRLGLVPRNVPESRTPLVPHAQLQPGQPKDGRLLPPSDETDPSRVTRSAAPPAAAGNAGS